MNANDPITPDAQQKQDRARKRKAILAGGVVLGLGAAVTLAAWSDDVFANGNFFTGTFEMEGNSALSTQTASWQQWDTTPGATLSFRQELSTTINPTELQFNETVWAPLSVRLSEATTTDGTYVLTAADWESGDASALIATPPVVKYDVYTVPSAADCEATASNVTPATGTPWYTSTVGTVTAASAHNLVSNASDTPGTPEHLCLGVTLTSNDQAYMGAAAATIVWEFTATANTP